MYLVSLFTAVEVGAVCVKVKLGVKPAGKCCPVRVNTIANRLKLVVQPE